MIIKLQELWWVNKCCTGFLKYVSWRQYLIFLKNLKKMQKLELRSYMMKHTYSLLCDIWYLC